MREPFALCRKAFDTPLGAAAPPTSRPSTPSRRAARFDAYADQFNHKREHSLEFQVVFLKHLLGDAARAHRPGARGPGRAAGRAGTTRRATAGRWRFFEAVARARRRARPARVVVVAGADMAHVGPRFGDPSAFDAASATALARRTAPRSRARASGDAAGFWAHVARDLDDAARLRPRAHLLAAPHAARAARGDAAPLRADGRRRRRLDREPRRARVLRVTELTAS